MTRQHLLVTTVVALLCGAILVLFTDIERPLLRPGPGDTHTRPAAAPTP